MGRARTTRVALIRAPIMIHSTFLMGPVPSIGLAYIAAVLRDAGHDVQLIDGVGEALDEFTPIDTPLGMLRRVGLQPAEIVDRIAPGTTIVGLTNMFVHEWPVVREIAELVKARRPEITVMIGGENATAFHKWMFEQTDAIDYCVLGEGEATAVELVDRLVRGRPVGDLEGVAVRQPQANPLSLGLAPRMTKLGELPRPAWDLVPLENYWSGDDYWGVNRGPSLPILATRGCPYQCTFCTAPQMWTTRYVVRDPADVAGEIAENVRTYGITNINFCDLTAITKAKWTLQFCDALDAENLDITWQLPTGTRAEALNAEVLQRLADTGCRNITYAPESGSPRLLEIMQKRLKLPAVLESIRAAHRIGIVTRIWIITGHPEERWGDIAKTFTFLVKAAWAGCDDAGIHNYAVYPGSEDFQKLYDAGRVVVDDAFYYAELKRQRRSTQRSYNDRISPRQLYWVTLAQRLLFYGVVAVRRPQRIYEMIRAQFRGTEDTYVDQVLRSRLRARKATHHAAPTTPDAEGASAAAGRFREPAA